MPATPFSFQDLPKVSQDENQLVRSLQSFWRQAGFPHTLVSGLEQLITKTLGVPCTISLERLFTGESEKILSSLPASGAYLLYGMTPVTQKMVMELDLYLAHSIIDRLLGGSGEPMNLVGPLTEVEEGILSYFILKVLNHIHERSGEGVRLHFRLEDLAPSWQGWKESLQGDRASLVLFVNLTLGHHKGYCKLVIPSILAQKGFIESFNHATKEGLESVSEQDLLDRFGWVESKLWAEVGETTLRSREIQGLAKGDVVFFDKTRVSLRKGQPTGEVSLKMGRMGRAAAPGDGSPGGTRLAKIVSAGKQIEVVLL